MHGRAKGPEPASGRPLERELSPNYVGFFDCFNRQLYFEAHEVLEEIWLPLRGTELDAFYKGLIQLAGAFVHIQKRRPGPAKALFLLARQNLARYVPAYQQMRTTDALDLIEHWLGKLTAGENLDLAKQAAPTLRLLDDGPTIHHTTR